MTRYDWHLECSACGTRGEPEGLPTVCPACGQPWLVRYPDRRLSLTDRAEIHRGHGMWRFRRFLPLADGEAPVTLGEGDTPLLQLDRAAPTLGYDALWLKDESTNPTGSFKARGLAMAVTRAVLGGAEAFVVPTAGNAGVALAAYAARAGRPARIYAPATTPRTILNQIRWFGGDLELLDGHIGDCGRRALEFARETGAFPMATLREPYRIEGKKTLGLEIARQMGWRLPDAVVYPAGGGTGLIGMWLAFAELLALGWVQGRMPRLYAVQSAGCAPVVEAVARGADHCEPWPDPWTIASGLRVPAPLGGPLMLRAIRESGGGAVAVSDAELSRRATEISRLEGLDLSPEGGASLAAAAQLLEAGAIKASEHVVLFNTGAGWLYRE
ncbi:MAG TPA: threonine synthase [Gemmatimonadales bacterium]|nr:threonine synthase [Gemmatimonadales bacterium]